MACIAKMSQNALIVTAFGCDAPRVLLGGIALGVGGGIAGGLNLPKLFAGQACFLKQTQKEILMRRCYKQSMGCAMASLLAAMVVACGGGGSPNDGGSGVDTPVVPTPAVPQSQGGVSGKVLDAASGQPIAGATVSVGALKTTSSADGSFALSGVPVTERAVVVVSSPVHADAAKIAAILVGQTALIEVRMLPVSVQGVISGIVGGALTDPATSASVQLPAGGIAAPSGGETYMGAVRVALTPMATPNCSTHGHPNCSRQDGAIMQGLR